MKSKNFKVSVVVPIMNEEGNIEKLSKKLMGVLTQYFDYEIFFVDDGSTDGSLGILKQQNVNNNKIKFLSFSRNFGHQNALRAGLDFAQGDCVISMDGDLQHPVELLPKLIEKWQEGYDIVYTIRKDDSNTPLFKRITASIFYWVMNRFADIEIKKGVADFRLLDRSVVEVIKTIKECDLFVRGAISWLGFNQAAIEYVPEKRNSGKTKYSFSKMIKFATSGITSFSIRPLQISTTIGSLLAIIAFSYGSYAIFIKLFTTKSISGWASLLTAVLFIGGIQLIMIGIMGEYIGRLFIEAKKRPNYIIKENSEEDSR